MSTPNSGTSTPNEINLATTPLGDVSRLAYLDNIPADDEPDVTPEIKPQVSSDVPTEEFVPLGLELETPDEGSEDPAPNPDPTPAPRTAENVVAASKKVRDYSDIAPEDVDLFKQMSDRSYVKAKEWYKATRAKAEEAQKTNEELEALRNYRYYEHPEAYKTSPDYVTASKDYSNQSAIANHWAAMLERLEEGQSIQDIKLDKDGNPFLDDKEIPASPALKARVGVLLQQAMSKQLSAQNTIEGLSTKFTSKAKEFDTQLTQAVNSLVAPELMNHDSFKKAYTAYSKLIPPGLANMPVYQHIAKMGAFIQLASQQIRALQQAKKTDSIRQAATRQQGPDEVSPGGQPTSIEDMDVADVLKQFERMGR